MSAPRVFDRSLVRQRQQRARALGPSTFLFDRVAEEAADRATQRGPADREAWERLGRLRLALLDREGALEALRRASKLGAGGEVPRLIAQALALEPRPATQSA